MNGIEITDISAAKIRPGVLSPEQVERLKIVEEAEGVSDSMSEALKTATGRFIAAGANADLAEGDMREVFEAFQNAIENEPAIYTNRAARRARARAERKNS